MFKDFAEACTFLGWKEKPLDVFLSYHESSHPVANQLFWYVRNALAERQLWAIYAAYLPNPSADYKVALKVFDRGLANEHRTMKLLNDDLIPVKEVTELALAGAEIVHEQFIREVTNLLLALQHTQREEAAKQLWEQVETDMNERNTQTVLRQIKQNIGA